MMRFSTLTICLALSAAVAGSGQASAQGMSSLRNFQSTHEKPDCAKGDPVVWLNAKGTIYYPESSKYYGYTPNGSWVCTSSAISKGAVLTKTVPQPSPAASAAASPAPTPSP